MLHIAVPRFYTRQQLYKRTAKWRRGTRENLIGAFQYLEVRRQRPSCALYIHHVIGLCLISRMHFVVTHASKLLGRICFCNILSFQPLHWTFYTASNEAQDELNQSIEFRNSESYGPAIRMASNLFCLFCLKGNFSRTFRQR